MQKLKCSYSSLKRKDYLPMVTIMKHETAEIVQNWLSMAKSDLESAELLHKNEKYSQVLYYLQQSNEKLAKGLLISFGILTPKKAKTDQKLKLLIGVSPKLPHDYRHNITRSFIADIDKMVPINRKYF